MNEQQTLQHELLPKLQQWAQELGFAQLGISDLQLDAAEQHLLNWLQDGFHGDMDFMHKHGSKRSHPAELVPGTLSVISVRMHYYPPESADPWEILNNPEQAYLSRYALGRDYHKVLRKRLQKLADYISADIGPFGYRAFVDSAPVLEKALAEKAGLGWIGKHSNLLNQDAGSWFFLGELYTDLALPVNASVSANHCGRCTACIDACPTQAIVEPYRVDARRCISYHTIELKGPIPLAFRRAMGNRIYGCDDCQLVCPWNRFAKTSPLADFASRHSLDAIALQELFAWSEADFLRYTEGSAIRRIGYERWQRNLAVALGNAPYSANIMQALQERLAQSTPLVAEHIQWALQEQVKRSQSG